MKLLISIAAIAAGFTFTGVAQATVTDACFDRGRGYNTCRVSISEKKVELATVRTQLYTTGVWAIHCEKANVVYSDYGPLRPNRIKVIRIASALSAPECRLVARFDAFRGHEARGRATLFTAR